MTQPEKILENQIIDWLNMIPRCYAWKHHVGGKRGQIRTKGNKYSPNGIPDIIGVHGGRFFAIEVKIGNKKPSDVQLEKIQKLLGCGGVAFWTNNFDHCKKTWGIHFGSPGSTYSALVGEKVLFEEG